MIKSIEFDKDYKDGYIFEKSVEYKKGRKNKYSRDGYDIICKEKGYKNEQLINNLIDKKFELSSDKINVFFGPNASGKTTILKTLAAYCMCGKDGMTNLNNFEPLDLRMRFSSDEDYNKEDIERTIIKLCRNKAMVKWDGYPVYYHNFKPIGNDLNEYKNSIVNQGGASYFSYVYNQNRISYGENSIFFINRIIDIMKSMENFEDFAEKMKKTYESYKNANEVWAQCFENTYQVWKNFVTTDKSKPTILLDEIDKSLDIVNTITLYTKIFPKIRKKINCQVVMVTHSPFILIDNKKMNDTYNIISLDDEYTNHVKEELRNIKFIQ